MMLKETKQKIEDTFQIKDIELFLKILDTCVKEKISIPDIRAYVQDNKKTKSKGKGE
jgi:hypothetical protein